MQFTVKEQTKKYNKNFEIMICYFKNFRMAALTWSGWDSVKFIVCVVFLSNVYDSIILIKPF